MSRQYEMVIGLEVHIELKTNSKIFCGCSTAFGAPPNTQCCPVCAGMPGVLPVLNRQVVEYAILAGVATGCTIAPYSKNDRKNYFYPDLPKAYQISQYDLPLCENGHIDIAIAEGTKRIGITRIHIEEDAGKLVHDEKRGTLIDLNRCGVPLIEVVSEPDMRSAEEAVAYLNKLRSIAVYTDISDAKMNEGSFRCDVNLSVREKGQTEMGTRTEMKNLNSFSFIAKAIAYEYERQIAVLEAGKKIIQETRRFDPATGQTYTMRSKENADDYRYFPDPDLLPILTDEHMLGRIRQSIPQLPDERREVYMQEYGLSAYHSEMLVLDKSASDFFEETARLTTNKKQLAAFVISEVFRLMNQGEEAGILIAPQSLADIVDMLAGERINSSAAKKLLAAIWTEGGDPKQLVQEMGLEQLSDMAELRRIAEQVVGENPVMAENYRNGKTKVLQALMGKAMGETGGRANPALLQQAMLDCLNA